MATEASGIMPEGSRTSLFAVIRRFFVADGTVLITPHMADNTLLLAD